jgi:hypothetical protein
MEAASTPVGPGGAAARRAAPDVPRGGEAERVSEPEPEREPAAG